MGESCQHKALCSCRNASEIRDYVKNKIDSCIQKYLSLEETANYLQENDQISHDLTESIWEQLQRESPDFFRNYNLRCIIARQTKMHNDMLVKQVSLMIEHGNLDICGASPAIGTFLQHPEGSRLLEKLATTSSYKTKASFASLALPDANGPSVTQVQIPNDPQNQLHQWSTSNDLASDNYLGAPTITPATTGPIVTQLQIPNDQQNLLHDYYPWTTSNDLAYNNLGAPTIALATTGQWCTSYDPAYDLGAPTYVPAATDQWSSSNDLSYTGGQTVGQAATMQEDRSTFEFGGDIGHNALSFQGMNMELLAEQLVMQSNEQLYDLDGQYQQQSQVQQNFSVEAQQTVQYGGGSNGVQYGGGSSNRMQYGGGGNEMQYGGGGNELHYGGGGNEMQYGGGGNELQYGGGGNEMPYGGGGNEMQYGGGGNELHYGGGNEMQYGGGGNELHYGESFDQQLCYTGVDTNQSMQRYTSVDQQQARGVKRHHPESEALNNPGSGDGALTTAQNQYDLQWQGQRQDP